MKRADKIKPGSEPYTCSHCGKPQGTRFNLKAHKSHCANGLSVSVRSASTQPRWVDCGGKFHRFVDGGTAGRVMPDRFK